MGFFRRTPPPTVRLDTAVKPSVELDADKPPVSLWTDAFGKLSMRALQVVIIVVIAVGAIWALRQVTVIVIPIALALILASAFHPFMEWMRRRGIPALLATIITLLAVLALIGAVIWLIVWAVRDQWDELATRAQEGIEQLLAFINTLPIAPSQEDLDNVVAQVTEFVTSSQFGAGALAGVGAVASLSAGTVLLIVVLFFFLKDGPRLWEFVQRPFHGESYERTQRIGRKSVVVLGAYVRGTAAVALVDAVGIFIGLLVLQVPLAIPLAVLIFLLSFIPLLGAVLGGVLAALVALVANGPVVALIVVGIVVVVNQLEGNFLQPVLMGKSMKLHSLVIFLSLAIGASIGGIVGAVLAVPLTAVVWGIVQVWNGDDDPARWARPKRRESKPTVG